MTRRVPRPSLPGFDHIKRFDDRKEGRVTARILPGEYYACSDDELITTVLGSCVSACIWDPEAGIGGMNHFMIASGGEGETGAEAGRYGLFAMEFLINTILKHGGDRARLKVKLAGGGHVIQGAMTIGADNVRFARDYLAAEGLELVAEHVEGWNARKLVFHPLTGRSKVMEMATGDVATVVRQEQDYAAAISRPARSGGGDIELF